MSRNELAQSASPYLIQHKDNPVHWRMWGPDALADAKKLNKPILLSIGYAACHWCHVMAHESFEDESTAAVMNELFVNIKVDREERPDIDHIYMSALHALGQHGGWPLTMFLTPDGAPFWGGTYFPKEPKYGRPSFVQTLKAVEQVFRAEPEKIRNNVATLSAALRHDPKRNTQVLSLASVDDFAERLLEAMDLENGGLRGAPKFPNASSLELLWRAGDRTQDSRLTAIVLTTLTRIAQGGIHDHLGGGFARYSVDERWLVPHFEKMLYDNAQLLELFAVAFQSTGESIFREAAYGIVTWLQREMLADGGAFCASLDADSEGVEGKYYVWTLPEIRALLGEDADDFCAFYDAPLGGNWHDEHTGQSVSILNRLKPSPVTMDAARLQRCKDILLDARAKRVPPGRDDKVLADWNGLMIAALARGSVIFNESGWRTLAEQAFRFVSESMGYGDDARLSHAERAGVHTRPGFASDYACMMRAALALEEARLAFKIDAESNDYLAKAVAWAATLEKHHRDPATDLLATAADDAADVTFRLAPTTDEAVPNAHGIYATALIELAFRTGDESYRERVDALLVKLAGPALDNPYSHASSLNALDDRLRKAEIVVSPEGAELLRAGLAASPWSRSVQTGEAAGAGRATVCVNQMCSLPIGDAAKLIEELRSRRAAVKA